MQRHVPTPKQRRNAVITAVVLAALSLVAYPTIAGRDGAATGPPSPTVPPEAGLQLLGRQGAWRGVLGAHDVGQVRLERREHALVVLVGHHADDADQRLELEGVLQRRRSASSA